MYCILTGRTVDLGKIIQDSILHAARGKSTIGLPHYALITELCQLEGVTWDQSDGEILKPRAPIDISFEKPTRRVWQPRDSKWSHTGHRLEHI